MSLFFQATKAIAFRASQFGENFEAAQFQGNIEQNSLGSIIGIEDHPIYEVNAEGKIVDVPVEFDANAVPANVNPRILRCQEKDANGDIVWNLECLQGWSSFAQH